MDWNACREGYLEALALRVRDVRQPHSERLLICAWLALPGGAVKDAKAGLTG